jgi:hypothetical protein
MALMKNEQSSRGLSAHVMIDERCGVFAGCEYDVTVVLSMRGCFEKELFRPVVSLPEKFYPRHINTYAGGKDFRAPRI